jgi:hypothetical protein
MWSITSALHFPGILPAVVDSIKKAARPGKSAKVLFSGLANGSVPVTPLSPQVLTCNMDASIAGSAAETRTTQQPNADCHATLLAACLVYDLGQRYKGVRVVPDDGAHKRQQQFRSAKLDSAYPRLIERVPL